MELEQRVKALEYEMKILKNEVQRTLLDIQEQILVHYYPQLRIEETKPSDGTVAAIEAIRQRQANQASASAPEPIAPAAPVPSPVPAAPSMTAVPTIKKVSLDEIREAQNELSPEDAKAKAENAQKMLEALVKRAGSIEDALRLIEEAKRG